MAKKIWHNFKEERPSWGSYILAELETGAFSIFLVPDEDYERQPLKIINWALIDDLKNVEKKDNK